MKHIIIILLIASLFSCSKDEVMPRQEDLIGTWKIVSVDYNGSYVPKESSSSGFKYSGKAEDIDAIVTFDENEITSTGSYNVHFSIQDRLSLGFEKLNVFRTGYWILDGKNLIEITTETDYSTDVNFNRSQMVNNLTIQKITSGSMIILSEEVILTGKLGENISEEFILNGTYLLEKE